MTISLTPNGTGLEWKNFLKTITINIGVGFEYIYGSKDKCIYVMQRDPNNQTIITVYDLRGSQIDKRTYTHYFNSFFEQDGQVWMSYYSWTEQVYLQGRFCGNAGITAIQPFNG